MSLKVLSVGSNPNLAFYSWRLCESGCDVTVVNPTIKSTPIIFNSPTFGSKQAFTPANLVHTLAQLSSRKYNIILLACSTLQDFQSKCSKLTSLMYDDTLIVVESTGYVKLEPFVQLSLPKHSNVVVVSIMNDADVRQLNNYEFNHTLRNNESRIYLGSSSPVEASQNIRSNKNFQEIYLFLDSWSSSKQINFLTSLNPKEFTTYQWKLALPRIVFLSLSIIFEAEFPEELASQILCKPLITGLINEVFKIIKKMDCKLVKGFENEANLLKSWTLAYPVTKQNQDYINSPRLLYNFYKNYDLEIDLLLLQPILLADDFNTKSPYLENLYSMLCQYIRVNKNQSIFFMRKNDVSPAKLAQLENIDKEISNKRAEHATLEQNINDRRLESSNLDQNLQENRYMIKQLKDEISAKESILSNLNLRIDELDQSMQLKQRESVQLDEEYKNALLRDRITPETPQLREISSDKSSTNDSSSDIPKHLHEKELELQKREQELRDRELALRENLNGKGIPQQPMYVDTRQHQQSMPPQNMPPQNMPPQKQYAPQQYPPHQYQQNQNYPQYQQYPPYQHNGYYGSPMDQQPPHGLPENGLPPNGLPQNLRGSHSMTGGQNRYQHPVNIMQQAPQRQRVPSIPSMNSFDNQAPHYNHPSFNNAAPIDPLVEQRFRNKPKVQNRRSQFPQMNGNMDGLDMGGRGGMPMPNQKPRGSIGNGLNANNGSYPSPQVQQKKSSYSLNNQFLNLSVNQGQYSGQQHLAPPAVSGGSNTSGTSSTNTYDSVKTGNGYYQPEVPYDEPESKPVEAVEKKKKKRGIF